MIASDDELEDHLPAPSPPHLQHVANAAQADAELHNQDEMPALVTSSDSNSDGVPALESDSDDDGEDLVSVHESEYEESLSDENSAFDEMPPLLPAGYTSSFTELGANHHQPMTLDQLDAVDQLSHVMEESAGVAASGNRVSPVSTSPWPSLSMRDPQHCLLLLAGSLSSCFGIRLCVPATQQTVPPALRVP